MLRITTIACVLLLAPGQSRAQEAERGAGPSEQESLQVELEAAEDVLRSGSELTPELQALRKKVRRCLASYYQRHESIARRSAWEIMHTFLAYGVDTEVWAQDHKVNAIGWLCWNGPCRGQRLLYTQNGEVRPRSGAGLEGHSGQFLALLALSRVRSDYQIKAGGHEFTVEDLVKYEQKTCRAGTELTFKLIGLVNYLDSEATWQSQYGEAWSIQRLIQEEMAQSVVGAACGGTHRMMGFASAVHHRRRRGEPFVGQWERARKYVEAFHQHTFKLQNPDGSFSSNWFEGRGDWGGIDRRLQTNGHTLEWLVFSLPQEQLRDPRVIQAVDYLADLLLRHSDNRWQVGSRGHALHALVLYDERVFGSQPGQRAEMLLATQE